MEVLHDVAGKVLQKVKLQAHFLSSVLLPGVSSYLGPGALGTWSHRIACLCRQTCSAATVATEGELLLPGVVSALPSQGWGGVSPGTM